MKHLDGQITSLLLETSESLLQFERRAKWLDASGLDMEGRKKMLVHFGNHSVSRSDGVFKSILRHYSLMAETANWRARE